MAGTTTGAPQTSSIGVLRLLGPQLPAAARGTVGLAGVTWPSRALGGRADPGLPRRRQRGRRGRGRRRRGGPGGAGRRGERLADPTLDADTLAGLRAQFPAAIAPLDEMATMLAGPASDAALAAFHRCLGEFSRLAAGSGAATDADDGEGDKAGAALPAGRAADAPRRPHHAVRALPRRAGGRGRRARGRRRRGDGVGGVAGFGAALGQLLHGAKEALRQATYWQMKNRAGTVGRVGLGPVLGQLAAGVRVHLVGHSFGGRLVSFALAGLPAGNSPVRAVTLMEGAFSHFTFASPLPFDAGRNGALAGMLGRINGPLVACFSEHDGALGRFYPLASFAAQEDAAAAVNPSSRWGAIGANGAQGVGASAGGHPPVGGRYGFAPGAVLNVDASEVVRPGARRPGRTATSSTRS